MIETITAPPLRQGRLYLQLTRGTRLLRLLAEDDTGTVLLFKLVALEWNPVSKEVVVLTRKKALLLRDKGRLQEYAEEVRAAYMSWPDEELVSQFASSRKGVDIDKNRAWLADRDEDYKLIEDLGEAAPHTGSDSMAHRGRQRR